MEKKLRALFSHEDNQFTIVDPEQSIIEILENLESHNVPQNHWLVYLIESDYRLIRISDLINNPIFDNKEYLYKSLSGIEISSYSCKEFSNQIDQDEIISSVKVSGNPAIIIVFGMVVGIVTPFSVREVSKIGENEVNSIDTEKGNDNKSRLSYSLNSIAILVKKVMNYIKKNTVVAAIGFLVLTLFPTIWFFAVDVLPVLKPDLPVMSGEWNIAVANFTIIGDVKIDEEQVNLLSSVLYSRLLGDLAELGNDTDLVVQLLGPDTIGFIPGKTADDRTRKAEELAAELNADILIFGTIENIEGSVYVAPEFYVSIDNQFDVSEFSGQHSIGKRIRLVGVSEEISSQIHLNKELSQRTQMLSLVTKGLSSYIWFDYESALMYFNQADNDQLWISSEGREVLKLFIGNAAISAKKIALAEESYLASVQYQPNYSRGYIGLGNANYLLGLSEGDEGSIKIDEEYFRVALEYFDEANYLNDGSGGADINVKVMFGKGQVYLAWWLYGGDYFTEAIESFEGVIANYTEDSNTRIRDLASESYARMAIVEQKIGNYSRAIELYNESIALCDNPARRGLFHASLADIYLYLEDIDNFYILNQHAIEDYEMALIYTSQDQQIAHYWHLISKRYEKNKQYELAIDAINQAITISTNDDITETYISYLDGLNNR